MLHSSVIVGFAREQARLRVSTSTWKPELDRVPPATPQEPCHDALAVAKLCVGGALTVQMDVVLYGASVKTAVSRIIDAVQVAGGPELAEAVAGCVVGELAGTGVIQGGSNDEMVDIHTELELPESFVVATWQPPGVADDQWLTPHGFVGVAVQQLARN